MTAASSSTPEAGNRHADVILTGGTILTLDPSDSVAVAVAIRGERIVATGSASDLEPLSGPGTKTIALEGRTVIPGIIDTHAHMEREGLKTLRPSLAGARCVDDILEIVRKAAQGVRPGQWVITMPVGQPPFYFGGPQTLAEKRMPTREELDRAAPDHPVCIAPVFANWGEPPGYTALNSLALRRLDLDAGTIVTASDVELVRDPDTGEPTGLIIDRNRRPRADFSLLKGITGFGFTERVEGLRRSLKAYNAVGTTTVYEGHGSSPETIAVYRELWEQHALTVRSHLCVSPAWTSAAEGLKAMRESLPHIRGRGFGDSHLRLCGLFVGIAGDDVAAAASRGALPNTGWAGFVEWSNSPDDFRAYVRLAAELDIRVNTIVGDHMETVLSIFEEVDRAIPLKGRRWLIEHVKLMSADQIARAKKLGLVVTTIPVYMIWKNGGGLTRDMPDLEDYVPHASLLAADVPVSTGTDNIPYNPFVTLQTVIERVERKSGSVLGPSQSVSVRDGLRMLTSNAAYVCFEEDERGTIEAGKLADLAVLDRNPLEIPSRELPEITVNRTFLGGKVVHGEAVDGA